MKKEILLSLDELKLIVHMRVDWSQVFRDVYKYKGMSWYDLTDIFAWKEMTDEIMYALWKQIEKEIKERDKLKNEKRK